MAEIVGLAASAAGLLSLGLQVYDGIASYINDFNDRGSDISAVSTRAESLRISITELQQILPKIAARHSVGGTAAIPALNVADTELRALKSFLDELQGPPAQTTSMKTTIREQKKKLVYPFRRPTLEKLEKRLDFANSALRTGIQSLGLLVIDSIDTSVSGVIQRVDRSHAAILGIQSKTESLQTSLSSMATTLVPINDTSSSMKDSLETFMAQTNTALTSVHEPLKVALPELRDGMANVSQQLRIIEDEVQMTTASMFSGFRDNDQKMDELMNIISRSAAQAVESASLISGDLASFQQQLSEFSHTWGANKPSTAFNPSSRALTRLASKPSALRDAYDNFQLITAGQSGRSASFEQHTHRQHGDLVLDSQRSCYCQMKTVAQHQTTRLAGFYLIKQTTTSQRHFPGCAFAHQSTIATENARRAVYTGLRGLLSVALELSISWRSGAGGFSISPSITVYPMVDEAKSPVFRVIELMRSSTRLLRGLHSPSKEETKTLIKVLQHSTATIIKLYRTNRCSVYDVNEWGKSPLHRWSLVLAQWSSRVGNGFEDRADYLRKHLQPIVISSINDMLQSGLPASLRDYGGSSALNGLFMCKPETFIPLFVPVLDFVPFIRHDIVISSYYLTVMSLSKSWGELFNKHPFMSKVFGFGPLGEAIVSGNKNRVQDSLAREDCDLHEKNVFHQTVFHLAVCSQEPEILRLILQAALATGELQQFDTPDINGNTALDFAAISSGYMCRNKKSPEPCIDCSCWLPFIILQPHGWQLSFHHFWRPNYLLRKSSYSCVLQLIDMIKRSRKELQAEGLRFLSRAEFRGFHLDQDHVLDGYASSVVHSLFQRGIDTLEILTDPYIVAEGSIYHALAHDYDTDLGHLLWRADLLFENGFNDVDCKDPVGATPLMVVNRRYDVRRPAFTLWLLDHGANPLMNWPVESHGDVRNPCLKAAHMLLRFSGEDLCQKLNIMCFREIALRIAPLELFDGCKCGCVQAEGCGTTKILFRELWSYFSSGFYSNSECKPRQCEPHSEPLSECKIHCREASRKMSMLLNDKFMEIERRWKWNFDPTISESTTIMVGRLSEFLRHLAVDFCQWEHVSTAALRLFTFEALGVRHTCCKMPEPPEHTPDEIEEIQEEDHALLTLLDELVEEFTMELRNSGDSLDKFLGRYWVGRIDEVLDELNAARMTEEERKATEELGITWKTASNECATSPRPRLSFEEEMKILEEKIDEIFMDFVRASGS